VESSWFNSKRQQSWFAAKISYDRVGKTSTRKNKIKITVRNIENARG